MPVTFPSASIWSPSDRMERGVVNTPLSRALNGDTGILVVASKLKDMFDAVVHNSKAAGPFQNCANGWFVEYIAGDSTLAALSAYNAVGLTGEAANFATVLQQWSRVIQGSFAAGGNVPGSDYLRLLEHNLDQITKIVVDILVIAYGDGATADEAREAIRRDIADLIDRVKNGQFMYNGRNPNGWISVWQHEHAGGGLGLVDRLFPVGVSPLARKLADILKGVMVQVRALPTEGHNPWLTSDWQIRYQAIFEAGSASLAAFTG
jgi:hypothetical protein